MSEYNCPKEDCDHSGSWISVSTHHTKSHGERIDRTSVLKEDIMDVQKKVDSTPTKDEYNELGEFSSRTCANEFGSWNDSLKECGISPNQNKNVTRDELLDEIERLGNKIGRGPKTKEMTKDGKFCVQVYEKEFGSWNNAIKEAGFSVNLDKEITKGKLIKELQEIAEELGRSPYGREMADLSRFGRGTYENYFGSWNDALKAAGLNITHEFDTSSGNGVRWKLEKWAKSVKEIDSHECQDCGLTNHLHAHHIKRKSNYPEKMYDIDNGVTVCVLCHAKRHKGESCYDVLLSQAKDLSNNIAND